MVRSVPFVLLYTHVPRPAFLKSMLCPGFRAFNGGASLGSVGLGVSPKEVNVPGMGIVGMQKGGETPPDDIATKQCVFCVLLSRPSRAPGSLISLLMRRTPCFVPLPPPL